VTVGSDHVASAQTSTPDQMPSSPVDINTKPTETSTSVVLEAHPGSPVDLSGRRKPSLAVALAAQRPYLTPRGQTSDSTRSPPLVGKKENCIKTSGVVAKSPCISTCKCEYFEVAGGRLPKTKTQIAATQPFFVPAKVPELSEVHSIPSPSDDGMSLDGSLETAMDFHFEEENGIWISAIPIARDSRSSIGTSTTTSSTFVDDHHSCHGVSTVDTSMASSTVSFVSASESAVSLGTNQSDIYGWEEELDRKSSLESRPQRFREGQRKLSPARNMVPRHRFEGSAIRRVDGKRKSLLHRVLNISRREVNEPLPIGPSKVD
jgi:hypothetical protein